MNQSNSQVLVTGASGQQGGAVAKALLKKGVPVRAASRHPEGLEELVSLGATTVFCDFYDKDSILNALEGVQRAFLVTTFMEKGMDAEVQQGINFIDVAKSVGLEYIVFNSVANADRHTNIPHFETKWKIEQHLKNSGIPHCVIRPVFFMENFATFFADNIKEGVLRLPHPADKAIPMIALDVIGKFAAAAFIRKDQFVGKSIDIASDELTFNQVVEILSINTRKHIEYEEMSHEEAVEVMGSDFARMFEWFVEGGFKLEMDEIKHYGIHLTTFQEFVATSPFVQEIKSLA